MVDLNLVTILRSIPHNENFKIGDDVFALYRDVLFKAKIKSLLKFRYEVHYIGWNKCWDEVLHRSKVFPRKEPFISLQLMTTDQLDFHIDVNACKNSFKYIDEDLETRAFNNKIIDFASNYFCKTNFSFFSPILIQILSDDQEKLCELKLELLPPEKFTIASLLPRTTIVKGFVTYFSNFCCLVIILVNFFSNYLLLLHYLIVTTLSNHNNLSILNHP